MGLLKLLSCYIHSACRHSFTTCPPLGRLCRLPIIRPLHNRSTELNFKNLDIRTETDFLTQVLERYRVYDSHLFRQGPYKLSEDQLKTLTDLLKDAVTSQDLEEVCKLAECIPSVDSQRTSLVKLLTSSNSMAGHLKLNHTVTTFIEDLKKDFNNANLSSLLRIVYFHSWQIESDYGDSLATDLDKLMVEHAQHIDIATWCQFLQLKFKGNSANISREVVECFAVNILPKSYSIVDLLAVSVLILPISKQNLVHQSIIGSMIRVLSKNTVRHSATMFKDLDVLAVVCRTYWFTKLHRNAVTRSVKSLLWEVVVHHMKYYHQQRVSVALDLCLTQAMYTMDNYELTKYPYLLDKTFTSVEAVYPKLYKLSPVEGVALFHQMINSRHIDAALAEKCLKYFKSTDWKSYDVKTASRVIAPAALYGCTDIELYKPLIDYILSPESSRQFLEDIRSLILTLASLSFINVFPHSLYSFLFEQLSASKGQPVLSYSRNIPYIAYLNGVLSIHCPTYSGTKLDRNIEKICCEPLVKVNRTDCILLADQIVDCLNTLPAITTKYIVESRQLLKHYWFKEITLSTMKESEKAVVIVAYPESDLLKVYHGRDQNNARRRTLQLTGLQRSHLAQLRALGHNTIFINSNEMEKAPNRSRFLLDKLKEAGAL